MQQQTQIDIIGNLFDLSFDNEDIKGIEHGFKLAEQIDYENLDNIYKLWFHYDIANGWSYLRTLNSKTIEQHWDFNADEVNKEIYNLRKAIAIGGDDSLSKSILLQAYTNLGNLYSYLGRYVDALESWGKALEINPTFGMANINIGNGLQYSSQYLFDTTHKGLYSCYAYHYFRKGLRDKNSIHISIRDKIHNRFNQMEQLLTEQAKKSLPDLNSDYSLGDDTFLASYRKWCLNNTLYINPLNDLGSYNIACHDCLNMPTIIVSTIEGPIALSIYNQIKQEFGTARYLCYKSLHYKNLSYSDQDIVIIQSYDNAIFSYKIEQLKNSFRIAYSLFDKIAYLLNIYLDLGIDTNKVNFKNIWYSNPQKRELRDFFKTSDNWLLRGLYWISKDLYSLDEKHQEVIEPDAKEIATIRNYIEHKILLVTRDLQSPDEFNFSYNTNAIYTITQNNLQTKTIKLLKIVRSAIVYTSLAINREEIKKPKQDIPKIDPTIIPPEMRT